MGGASDGDVKTLTDTYMSVNDNRIFYLSGEVITLYKKKKDTVKAVDKLHELGLKPKG